MNDDSRRKWEGFQRMHQFGVDNASDFGAGSPAFVAFTQLGTLVGNVDTSAAEQSGAEGQIGLLVEYKSNVRETVRDKIQAINRLARSMVYTFPGIDDLFKMPRNSNDADLPAAGRAFHTNSGTAGYEAAFIARGLPGDFRDTLHDACDDFESAMSNLASKQADRAEATAEITDWILQGMRLRRALDGIVRTVYDNNPGKLAAWLQAAHIEKAPSKPKPPTP